MKPLNTLLLFSQKSFFQWQSNNCYSWCHKWLQSKPGYSLTIVFILLLFLPEFALSQARPPLGQKSRMQMNYRGFFMKTSRLELGGNVSAANAMTDIAASESGAQASITDVYVRGFTPSLSVFSRYRFSNLMAVKGMVGAHLIKGNDRWSQNIDIVNRGKSFSNTIVEFSFLTEVYMPKPKPKAKIDFNSSINDVYIFAGIAGFYHSPLIQGPIIDDFDQSIVNATNLYSSYQMAIPFGLGIQRTINNTWVFGFDFNFRYTFFDYLDGFVRPYTNRSDFYFTTGLNVSYIISSKSYRTTQTKANHVFRGGPY